MFLYWEEYRKWKTWKKKDHELMSHVRLNIFSSIRLKVAECNTSRAICGKLAELKATYFSRVYCLHMTL